MRVLVCGGRYYEGAGAIECLDQLDITILIQGEAAGADRWAKRYALSKGIHCAGVPALWDCYGKGAGFKRNSALLLLQPEYCVAFPGGKGTDMMVKLCEEQGIPVWRPYG